MHKTCSFLFWGEFPLNEAIARSILQTYQMKRLMFPRIIKNQVCSDKGVGLLHLLTQN